MSIKPGYIYKVDRSKDNSAVNFESFLITDISHGVTAKVLKPGTLWEKNGKPDVLRDIGQYYVEERCICIGKATKLEKIIYGIEDELDTKEI